MKGIILSGGKGSRLYPITLGVSKQLLPLYDLPMIYYPLSILLNQGITEIAIICVPESLSNYKRLLGDGKRYGVRFEYIKQPKPNGIAESILLSEEFLDEQGCVLILGDNLFHGYNLDKLLLDAISRSEKNIATIFSKKVSQPNRYGIVQTSPSGKILSIEEKPKIPRSNLAITGLYVYPKDVLQYAKQLKPSRRGELEITDLNLIYHKNENLFCENLDDSFTWFDAGTIDSFYEASEYVRALHKRTGLKLGCLEYASLNSGLINKNQIFKNVKELGEVDYASYLLKLCE